MDVVHVHAFAQHLDDAEGFDVLRDALGQLGFQVFAFIFIQHVLLCALQESPQPSQVNGQFLVHVLGQAPIVLLRLGRLCFHIVLPARHAFLVGAAHQGFLYQCLEGLFVGFG